jgi:hypothetical protein
MFDIMGNHYDNIKETIGIKQIFEATDSDEETDMIF